MQISPSPEPPEAIRGEEHGLAIRRTGQIYYRSVEGDSAFVYPIDPDRRFVASYERWSRSISVYRSMILTWAVGGRCRQWKLLQYGLLRIAMAEGFVAAETGQSVCLGGQNYGRLHQRSASRAIRS
jgi:hypothetical protein